MIFQLFVLVIAIVFLFAVWYLKKNLIGVRSTQEEKIEKILGQVLTFVTLLSGFSFFQNVTFDDTIADALKYILADYKTIAAAVAAIINFAIGLYRLLFKGTKEAVVSAYLEIAKSKDITASSNESIEEYAHKIAA